MARIRSIKPELRTSITVSSWPFEVRYFFVLLWGYLDDYGRGVDDELLIASDCFPRDRHITPDIVDSWLELMADAGPLCRYEVDGRRYLHCPNWSEHQKPQHPGKPRVPPCPDDEKDDFLMWRGDNPPREYRRSRRSHEGVTRVSPATFGGSQTPSGEASGAPISMPEATIYQIRGEDTAVPSEADKAAGQGIFESTRETLMSLSGDTLDTLTPEQGAGSREQGSRENNASVNAAVALRSHRADVEEACSLLADLVEANGSKRPTITTRWRDAARLMLDRDGRTLDQILAAIRWSQNDEFWRANIRAMPKLREQYDTLRLQAQRGRSTALAPTGTSGPYPTGTDARIAEHYAVLAEMEAERTR